MTAQGDIWWADLREPIGSEAGHRRPVLVIQSDSLNNSRISTLLCVPLTGNLKWVSAPGNVLLRASDTGLRHDSLAVITLTLAVDRAQFIGPAGQVTRRQLHRVFDAMDLVLGR